ncbi:MAG: hypothetical protein IH621_00840, partial [Krumholzibacteria bacterium]|nr:hypothetical protein [Candidatus Krumholzibacteria bacterium]
MTAMLRDHPDDEQLFAVVHGLAGAGERTLVLDHVRGCARCEAEFRALDRTREAARGDLPPAGAVPV